MSAALVVLADEVRSKTLAFLDKFDEATARRKPHGSNNTILWHAGHSYVVVEWLVGQGLGQTPIYPGPEWFNLFSWDSDPAGTPSEAWPSLAAVKAALREQHARLRALSEAVTEEHLAAPFFEPGSKHTNLRQIVHGWHDEACHCGEIHLIRKQFANAN